MEGRTRARLGRRFERLLDLVPAGVEFGALRELVGEDLIDEQGLDDLLGEPLGPDGTRTDIPRVRPILVVLAARSVGAGVVDGHAQYVAELLHMALSVHDLALGRGGGRRRRVARRLVRGSMSLLGGNHLTLRALELARYTKPEILEELVDTLRHFADSQALADELRSAPASSEDWLEHADGHTGALFTFCCRAGGHLAHATPAELRALGRYGRHMGRLWHIAEDVSGLLHHDPVEHLVVRASIGRPMLPVVAAAERDPTIADLWTAFITNADDAAAAVLAQRIVRSPGMGTAREAMVREAWSARRALSALPRTSYRVALDRLAGGIARAGLVSPRTA
ncbi:MAG: geranylgeranyl pyrophosphate synthase [Myxococcota bacterium]